MPYDMTSISATCPASVQKAKYGRRPFAWECVKVLEDALRPLGPEHAGRYDCDRALPVFEHMADLDGLSASGERILRPGAISPQRLSD